MTVHSLHIFDRKGKTLFTKRFSSVAQQPPAGGQGSDAEQLAEQRKLVFGMLFSLRELAGSLAPEGEQAALHSIRTGAGTLHNYETMSGLRFAMYTNNDPQPTSSSGGRGGGGDNAILIRDALKHIYTEIWVECVVRSPLYRPGEIQAEGEGAGVGDGPEGGKGGGLSSTPLVSGRFDIRSTNFEKRLDLYLSGMPWFR